MDDIGAGSTAPNRRAIALQRSRSSRQGKRRVEQDVHVAAAARRDVGEDLAAETGHERGQVLGLSGHLGRGISKTLTIVVDSTIVNVATETGHVQVEYEGLSGTRAVIKHRHRARCVSRGLRRKRTGTPGRESAAAVARNPDVRRTRDRGRVCVHFPARKPGEPSVTNVTRYIQFHLLEPWMIT